VNLPLLETAHGYPHVLTTGDIGYLFHDNLSVDIGILFRFRHGHNNLHILSWMVSGMNLPPLKTAHGYPPSRFEPSLDIYWFEGGKLWRVFTRYVP